MDNLWSSLKALPLVKRMRKAIENKSLQQQINKLRVQQKKKTEQVEEMQTKVKQVSKPIGPDHLEIKQDLIDSLVRSLEHINPKVIKEVRKLKENVQTRVEEVNKVYQEFQSKLNMPVSKL